MNNITYGENKIKRIFLNDNLVDDIRYNNQVIVGYENSKNIEDVNCYSIVSGSASGLSNDNIWCEAGQYVKVKSKFTTNGFDYAIRLDSSSYYNDINVTIVDRGVTIFKLECSQGNLRINILGKTIYTAFISSGVKEFRIVDSGSSLLNNGTIDFYVEGSRNYGTTYSYTQKQDKTQPSTISITSTTSTKITATGGFNVCTQCQLD